MKVKKVIANLIFSVIIGLSLGFKLFLVVLVMYFWGSFNLKLINIVGVCGIGYLFYSVLDIMVKARRKNEYT